MPAAFTSGVPPAANPHEGFDRAFFCAGVAGRSKILFDGNNRLGQMDSVIG
jgi:hypothetical protein